MLHAERERKIQAFAESQGWTAEILKAGSATRDIFRVCTWYRRGVDLISDALPFGRLRKRTRKTTA